MWLTGGPGCSSEVALFGENGPCAVNQAGDDTIRNNFSWNSNANLLYVDQPTGTGFSYGLGLDHNEKGVAADMYDFLQQFMKAHPKYAGLDFYAVGESYAGHYVPAVTHKIWQNNQQLPKDAIKINLKGTSVGNGLTDPSVQYKYYAQMAISTNDHKPAVSNVTHAAMEAATGPCIAAIAGCQAHVPGACIGATDICNAGLLIPYTLTGMNPYDMRVKCAVPPLCYDFSNVAKYLARTDVRQQLGVGTRKWSDCNRAVAIEFELAGDWMHDFQSMLTDQLNNGIRVLIYAGDQDYICNWLGNQAWTQVLKWDHTADFNSTKPVSWNVDSKPAGTLQTSHGFSFLRVFDAGHMVPRDQPAHALAMINSFTSGKI
jgi:cathepsin A (carboxypeptidase C)